MKHQYTDEEIQAAIDAACKEIAKTHPAMGGSITLMSDHNKSTRLHLLKSALNKLPEPTPPVVDGKTPGQLLHEKFGNTTTEYPTLAEWYKTELEEAASAVLAAFGNKPTETPLPPLESWTLDERNAILRLATQQDMSPANVLKQSLRMYQMSRQQPTGQHGPAGMSPLRVANETSAASDSKVIRREREMSEAKAENAAMRATMQRLYDMTECCADGAPDASAHDKLCNELAHTLKPFLK